VVAVWYFAGLAGAGARGTGNTWRRSCSSTPEFASPGCPLKKPRSLLLLLVGAAGELPSASDTVIREDC